ncbi:hypothetical protein V5O48_016682 [Marasmius crinis-equi]|uniref:Uncharacterized protein n=1 Tax=Marasmius crinis-equi TaxID=585013 RepID=A0ABR3ER43_9AGAR
MPEQLEQLDQLGSQQSSGDENSTRTDQRGSEGCRNEEMNLDNDSNNNEENRRRDREQDRDMDVNGDNNGDGALNGEMSMHEPPVGEPNTEEGENEDPPPNESLEDELAPILTEEEINTMDLNDIKAAFLQQQAKLTETQDQLSPLQIQGAEAEGGNGGVKDGSITKPKGSAGTTWSLQVEMGLTTKDTVYQAILRSVRAFLHGTRIDWRTTWSQVSAENKSKLYALCREKIKFLRRFHNDWATSAIAAQYTKNL